MKIGGMIITSKFVEWWFVKCKCNLQIFDGLKNFASWISLEHGWITNYNLLFTVLIYYRNECFLNFQEWQMGREYATYTNVCPKLHRRLSCKYTEMRPLLKSTLAQWTRIDFSNTWKVIYERIGGWLRKPLLPNHWERALGIARTSWNIFIKTFQQHLYFSTLGMLLGIYVNILVIYNDHIYVFNSMLH